MSQENIELVLEAFRCFNEQNWERFAQLFEPDAVSVAVEGWPEPRAEGRDEIVAQFRRLRQEGVESHAHVDEATASGDLVITAFRWEVTGSATGLSEQRMFWAVWRLADRKIVRNRFFWDRSQAVDEAVRLRELAGGR